MRKKRLIAFGALLAALVAIGLFLLWPGASEPPVQVAGNFSPDDLAAIKRAVRHQMWQEAVPRLSWTSIKALGGVLKRNATEHLVSVQEAHIHVAQSSFTGDALATLKSGNSERTLVMARGSNGWYCAIALPGRFHTTAPAPFH